LWTAFDANVNGILLVDKPAGLTSHDVVARARKVLGEKKSGHSGTLDPQATGLLVLAFGEATRWLPYLPGDKRYRASIRFGIETDTEDIWGTELKKVEIGQLETREMRRALEALKQQTHQVPPMVSALKHQGKPLYEYARAGVEIERVPRPLEIFEFTVLALRADEADFELHCGAGTYVRSLCASAGRTLGVGACMSALRRTACGPFRVEEAVTLEAMDSSRLLGPEKALAHLKEFKVAESDEKALGQGRDLELGPGAYDSEAAWRLSASDGRLLGLGCPQRFGAQWRMHPERVFGRS
jgi:tRNA pseudouridine55 synthase